MMANGLSMKGGTMKRKVRMNDDVVEMYVLIVLISILLALMIANWGIFNVG